MEMEPNTHVTASTVASTTASANDTVTTVTATATVQNTSISPSRAISSKSIQSQNTTITGSGSLTTPATCSTIFSQGPSLTSSIPQILGSNTDAGKQEDINNLSHASCFSEGQRSLSGAPSASSSPILSPQGKIFGRNANGTLVTTSRPANEAEIQLYRVLQRASLLVYYDTLLEMGGDDVQQLYDAGEDEFLEIMALVGMASKPLHVRRLQKALHEWANNPSAFQGPMLSNVSALCDTPPKPAFVFNTEPTPIHSRNKFSAFSASSSFQSVSVLNPSQSSSTVATTAAPANLLTQMNTPVITGLPLQTHPSLVLPSTASTIPSSIHLTAHQQSVSASTLVTSGGSTIHQVTSSSPQLTPVLTDLQVQRITLGAEKIARQLPQREPRAQTSKKRTTRELEQVIAMSEHDPRRIDEIRKYSAIYGRFDCKRRPEKPLTLHEVCVNEAAAQLCRLVPALLTRRDELFPLARQIVKDAGFGQSASIARYGSLLSQVHAHGQDTTRPSCLTVDCESSDTAIALPTKRQRLSSAEATQLHIEANREVVEDSRYNLFAMYQKFAKPPFQLADISKFSLAKPDFDDHDSRFSFSNSASPPMSIPNTGAEGECCQSSRLPSSNSKFSNLPEFADSAILDNATGAKIISAAGGNIIAVANPGLALSPSLDEVLDLKRNVSAENLA